MPKVNYNELKENIQDSIYITIEATGTNNYVASSSLITSLKSKRTRFTLFVANDSTGNCTLNLNSFGAKNIKDANGNIVTKLKQNIPYNLVYNGQDFILQGKGGGGNAQPGDVRQGKKFTNDNGEQVGTRTNLDIAKELGITVTADNVAKGYKILDKNGNVVIGTVEDIGPGNILSKYVGRIGSNNRCFSSKYYSESDTGNNVGSGKRIFARSIPGKGNVHFVDDSWSSTRDFYYPGGFSKDGKYFFYETRTNSRYYFHKGNLMNGTTEQIINYEDDDGISHGIYKDFLNDKLIFIRNNSNNYTTIIYIKDFNGNTVYTSPSISEFRPYKVYARYNKVGLCGKGKDKSNRHIVVMNERNQINRISIQDLFTKLSITGNQNTTDEYYSCTPIQGDRYIISLASNSKPYYHKVCVNFNLDVIWHITEVKSINSAPKIFEVNNRLVSIYNGVEIYNKNNGALIDSIDTGGNDYTIDSHTGDLLYLVNKNCINKLILL